MTATLKVGRFLLSLNVWSRSNQYKNLVKLVELTIFENATALLRIFEEQIFEYETPIAEFKIRFD